MRDARHTRPFYFSEAHKRVGYARLHIVQSRSLYQNEHSLKLLEFAIVLYLRMRKNQIKIHQNE